MRPNGIVSRSTSPRQDDFEVGRNKGLLRRFLLGVRSRFEGKAGRGKRGCCHKSSAGLGMPPYAFAFALELLSIQHFPAHNKPFSSHHPGTIAISPNQSSSHHPVCCSLLSRVPICSRIPSDPITLFRMILPPTPTPMAFQRIPVDVLFRLDLEGRVFPAGYSVGVSYTGFSAGSEKSFSCKKKVNSARALRLQRRI